MGLVFITVLFSIAINSTRSSANKLLTLSTEINMIVNQIFSWITVISPIATFSLIVSQIIELDDITEGATKLALYVFTVMVGALLHTLVILPLIFRYLTKKNPYVYIWGMEEAIVMALGTASR